MLNQFGHFFAFSGLAIGVFGNVFIALQLCYDSRVPIADFPDTIYMGECRAGSVSEAFATVGNNGKQVLVLSGAVSSCSCLSVDCYKDGGFIPIKKLQIMPNEFLKLRVRVSVISKPGLDQSMSFGVVTNEKKKPIKIINVKISKIIGGIWTDPLVLLFDEINTGKKQVKKVELYSSDYKVKKVVNAKSSNSGLVSVNLRTNENQLESRNNFTGIWIGSIDVELKGDKEQAVNEYIEIFTNDQNSEPDRVPVYGKIISNVIADPQSVILNLESNGRLNGSQKILVKTEVQKIVGVKMLPEKYFLNFNVVNGPSEKYILIENKKDSMSLSLDCLMTDFVLAIDVQLKDGSMDCVRVPGIIRADKE